ncbi:hypothetical protein BH10PSE16_BH10PSE16_30330 [soil metagenome]
MQQNDAAPVLIIAVHGSKENYVLAVLFEGRALTFFQLLQFSDATRFSCFQAAWPLP